MKHMLPVLAARKRQLVGTILVALQIALTLAIIANAMFIIHERMVTLSQPTGLTESHLLMVDSQWVDTRSNTSSLIRSDLGALRHMPGVMDATRMFMYPLAGGGLVDMVKLSPDSKRSITKATLYLGDNHAIETMGLHLIAGRNFRPDEVSMTDLGHFKASPVVIITKHLADELYPDKSALGKPMYFKSTSHGHLSTIIGIVSRLQGIKPAISGGANAVDSVLMPAMLDANHGYYFLRTRPGQLRNVAAAVRSTLTKISRMRLIAPHDGIVPYTQIRAHAYKTDRGIAVIMTVVCVLLLLTTGGGIVGFSSFWVNQRRRQIGIRRALGATRRDILAYFLTENVMIAMAGALVGLIAAYFMNGLLMKSFEMARLPIFYVLISAIIVIALGQLAVYWPARKASRIEPVQAIRGS